MKKFLMYFIFVLFFLSIHYGCGDSLSSEGNTTTPKSGINGSGDQGRNPERRNGGQSEKNNTDDLNSGDPVQRNQADNDTSIVSSDDQNKNIDVEKRNPLQWAADVNNCYNLKRVKNLLGGGANVNAKTSWGRTPLHLAARGHCSNMVKLLLDNGADVNAKDKWGNTPLHLAMVVHDASEKEFETIKLLLDNKANPDAGNKYYNTPLIFLFYHYRGNGSSLPFIKKIVNMFLDKGADINARNRWRETPLSRLRYLKSLISENLYSEIVTFLIEKGATY